jgi:hypothetical protein
MLSEANKVTLPVSISPVAENVVWRFLIFGGVKPARENACPGRFPNRGRRVKAMSS